MSITLDPAVTSPPSQKNIATASKPLRLAVVGGGMAAYGLCQSLVDREAYFQFSIDVYAEEPRLPYDRVNLSKVLLGKTEDDLLLKRQRWYDDHEISVHTSCRIESIDRDKQQIVDSEGRSHSYDKLILATGSYPFVPPVPGHDSPGVFVYRTVEDLNQIRDFVRDNGAKLGGVIGGGLLGLEAAKILHDLGLKTTVVEMAPGLMPRQLDSDGAKRLRDHVESIGVDVNLVRRTERINHSVTDAGADRITLEYSNADPDQFDILVIAAGVRPNDNLARQCGLELGSRGGIVIDEKLQTSDPNVFAIGECAAFRDHVYGLVAPCYRMADVLGGNLAGSAETFQGADESAELKLMGVQVVTLGRMLGQSAGGVVLAQEDDDAYRKLIVEQGKVVGASCVGPWDDLARVRHAVQKQKLLWPMQRARFKKTGSPWSPGGNLPVHLWPEESIVCACVGVTRGAITQSIASGADSADAIASATRASTSCGSCRSLVCELAGGEQEVAAVPGAKIMLAASIASAVLTLALLVLRPIEMATSVQQTWREIDVLWRTDFYRQVTGYTTLALTVIGLVFSLRKRFDWFSWGSYSFWRSVHGVLGAAVLVAIAVHTGLRLGENLNFLLGCTFLAVAAVGSAVGIISSLEAKATGERAMLIRQWRPRLTTLHTILFWPLPALVAIHIFTFYWFSD